MNLNKRIAVPTATLLLLVSLYGVALEADLPKHNFKPPDGYVSDEKTAISIAVAVWGPIYGMEKIEKEKPYTALLDNGVWHVSGTLHKRQVGGVAEAEIQKADGRIIRISHGK